MRGREDLRQLETELELGKRDLREDAHRIKEKLQATRAQLSPTNLARQKILPLAGWALVLGFVLG